MAVDLKTATSAVSVTHGLAVFASNQYDQDDTPPVTAAQARPKLVATSTERMGAGLAIDLAGLVPDGAIAVYEAGVEVASFADAASFSHAMPGMMTSPVHAQFVANGVTYRTPNISALMDHAVASHAADDDRVVALVPHATMTICAKHAAVGDWSDPAMWDLQRVPGPGDRVLIDRSADITYDMGVADRLDVVRVDGILRWAADRSTEMLVETIVVTPTGHLIMGDAITNRLPAQFTARVTISNRSYGIDPTHPTDLDFATDTGLISRGILALGKWTAFGTHRETHVKTAMGHLPMAGDTSVRLSLAPEGWQVGDTVIVGGTMADLNADGVNTRYDEEREIISIAQDNGAWVIAWDAGQPLLYDHDWHNDTIDTTADGGDSADVAAAKLAVRAELDALQLPIAVKERNIIIRSEPGAAIHQRGHTMVMHMASRADLWDVAFLSLGRTDKSKPAGSIKADGLAHFVEPLTGDAYTEIVTAQTNIQSRYPVHLHFCGFDKPHTDLVRDCYVEDAKAWAMVHHGCRANWIGNVMYRYQGAGMVSETANELGRWDNNLAIGLDTTAGSYRYPKGAQEDEGKRGDFARQGYGYFYRGRAMVVTRCIAIGATWGHVFYHRGNNNDIAPQIDHLRSQMDLNDLTILQRGNVFDPTDAGTIDTSRQIQPVNYPIIHFDKCESIGCAGAVAVVKNAAEQQHDLNIKISNFKGWAVKRGLHINYVGAYLLQDVVLIGHDFNVQVAHASSETNTGVSTGKSNQVAVDNFLTAGFNYGVTFDGGNVQGISNSDFSQADPRFIYGENISFDNIAPVAYASAPTDPTLTQDVTRFLTAPVDRTTRPSVDLPFIVGDFSGSNLLTNLATCLKTDNVSSGGVLPKEWDTAGLPYQNNQGIRIRDMLGQFGYWTYQGENILIFPVYFADRASAFPIKQMHALRCTGTVSQYTNNGPFTRSASAPVCPDITRNITIGIEDSFNLLALATGAPGTTLSLDIPWITNNADVPMPKPAHVKPNYLDFEITAGGQITANAPLDYVGVDRAFSFIYDGQGRFCTVEITYQLQAA